MKTESRKLDHIRICLEKDVSFKKATGLERVELSHNALPDIDFDEIDLSVKFLGKSFKAPLFIEAMTGGTPQAEKINRNLAIAARELGIGMGVGSQRAMLEDKSLARTYSVRDVAPKIFLAGNIGAAQLLDYPPEKIGELVRAIKADALAVHLNAAQELVQDEGDRNWKGVSEKIRQVCKMGFPVIAKETGAGISGQAARRLVGLGVDSIDIAGAGGTSWTKVEHYRGNKKAESFFDWGMPTALALEQCARSVRVPIISSGGIRTGIDAAKSIAMGATLAGMALPLLKPATVSEKEVQKALDNIVFELKGVMFLLGARNLEELRRTGYRIRP